MKPRTRWPSPQPSPAKRERGKSPRESARLRERKVTAMRVLLLSDTHGLVDERIVALASDCDVIVHAGDVGNASGLATLRSSGANVVASRGNNDVASKWPRG